MKISILIMLLFGLAVGVLSENATKSILKVEFEGDVKSTIGKAIPTVKGDLEYEVGRSGKGILVDGLLGGFLKYTGPSLPATAGTISFWIKPEWNKDDPTRRTLFVAGNRILGVNSIYIEIKPAGKHLVFEIADKRGRIAICTIINPLKSQVWTKLSFSYMFSPTLKRGAELGIYVNNKLASQSLNSYRVFPQNNQTLSGFSVKSLPNIYLGTGIKRLLYQKNSSIDNLFNPETSADAVFDDLEISSQTVTNNSNQ